MSPAKFAKITIILCCLAPLADSVHGQSGMLQSVREQSNQSDGNPTPARPKKKERKKKRHHDHCDDGDLVSDFAGILLQGMISASLQGAATVAAHEAELATGENPLLFPHYPYADGHTGYRFVQHSPVRTQPIRPEDKGTSVWFEHGSDWDSLQRYSIKFLWEDRVSWNLDGEFGIYQESGAAQDDSLLMGDFNVLVPLGSNEHFSGYLGAGINWMAGETDAVDWNLTYRFNAFPQKPWIISGEFDYGELGHVHTSHVAGTVGYAWEHLELFAGYDYRRIGSVELQGPTLGLRMWW